MDLEKELQAIKKPVHIVLNRGRKNSCRFSEKGKWYNMLTEQTYLNDAALIEYLKTYKPLPEWYTWDSWQKKKQAKLTTL